jgi:hypothetical protein
MDNFNETVLALTIDLRIWKDLSRQVDSISENKDGS